MIDFGDDILDVFLQPGDFHFGAGRTRISTLLGSCISITLWHPARLIGGMCHFMLPSRGLPAGVPLDGRYADEALAMFDQAVAAALSRPADYQVKVFGGGNMLSRPGEGSELCWRSSVAWRSFSGLQNDRFLDAGWSWWLSPKGISECLNSEKSSSSAPA